MHVTLLQGCQHEVYLSTVTRPTLSSLTLFGCQAGSTHVCRYVILHLRAVLGCQQQLCRARGPHHRYEALRLLTHASRNKLTTKPHFTAWVVDSILLVLMHPHTNVRLALIHTLGGLKLAPPGRLYATRKHMGVARRSRSSRRSRSPTKAAFVSTSLLLASDLPLRRAEVRLGLR